MEPEILDGPVGTELEARGLELTAPLWSGRAIREAPELLAAVHADYARAGATVHTAATFRTTPARAGSEAASLSRRAVQICREAVQHIAPGARVFGSLAPLGDCYRPDQTPSEVRVPHREHAQNLVAAGVDGILVETFANPEEMSVAVEEAVSTGVEVWASFTAGPMADLVSPATGLAMARDAHGRGAQRVLVNCVAIDRIDPFVEALATSGLPWGVYPNAGAQGGPFGWSGGDASACEPWFDRWLTRGAGVIGACCGMGPEHVSALSALVSRRAARSTTARTDPCEPPR